jgi:hypothetical protein
VKILTKDGSYLSDDPDEGRLNSEEPLNSEEMEKEKEERLAFLAQVEQ